MTPERWQELMDNEEAEITPEEWRAGWHFCPEFDGLLMGPDDDSMWLHPLWVNGRCVCGKRIEKEEAC